MIDKDRREILNYFKDNRRKFVKNYNGVLDVGEDCLYCNLKLYGKIVGCVIFDSRLSHFRQMELIDTTIETIILTADALFERARQASSILSIL